MEERQLAREVVEEHFPDECQEIGETTLRQILSSPNQAAPVKVPGAHEHDLSAVIATVTAVVALVRQVIGVYKDLRSLGRRPNPDEVTEKLGPDGGTSFPGGDGQRKEIVASVVRRLASDAEHDPGDVR